MTILVKKVFISSKPTFVYLLCPPLCGPFSIQESAAGGLSYKVKKNVPWHILAPRAVACDNLHLRASAHLWHVSAFLCNREFLGISCYIKKRFISPYVDMNLFFLFFRSYASGFSTWTIACFCIGIRQFLLLPNSTITVSSVISMITP